MSYEVYGPYIPVVMLITFIGLFIWVLLPGNKKGFDNAANLPFEEDGFEADSAEEKVGDNDRRKT
ncbi:MAG: cbb3-type cytochrome c oxidase subunit 3 [Pseudomonadales bacterium]|nr:cbb3-type cytochrome c oxidase subunit 3 [Pseudomonadales bacterium]NRA16182.1 cbb3-type cytochrome c oxidase subunit 3 [Oceanospirillaceae bacterium]